MSFRYLMDSVSMTSVSDKFGIGTKYENCFKIANINHRFLALTLFPLKGLSHEIFTVIFWLEWIYIGLKGNRFWFLNFKDVSSILDSNFKC